MPKAKKISEVVLDFLIGQIDPCFLDAYESLTKLEFPIPDYKSFRKQVDADVEVGSSWKCGGGRLVSALLGPHDFPIMTPQGALEKFHSGLVSFLDVAKFPGNSDLEIPRGESKEVGPRPEEVRDICWEAAQRVFVRCRDNDNSTVSCRLLALVEYWECTTAWNSVSLPFAKKGLRPETFVGRPPSSPPFPA